MVFRTIRTPARLCIVWHVLDLDQLNRSPTWLDIFQHSWQRFALPSLLHKDEGLDLLQLNGRFRLVRKSNTRENVGL